ncbi:hypothetical protein EU528_12220 [Candidatus Thorarchaeota archaeon]|nr:MAG: hypothetical protein EU528_12220 [Candidatus Thorarchaeota archaeon]
MVEHTQFPEFERRIEKGYPRVYHEEWDQRYDILGGAALVLLGFIPYLWIGFTIDTIQILGLIGSFLGVLIVTRGLVEYRKLTKQYSFHGLNRATISNAIMYIDGKIARPEDFESPAPYHDKTPFSDYKASLKNHAFINFLMSTIGLITWPSFVIDEYEQDMRNNKRSFYYTLSAVIVVIFILALVVLYFVVEYNFAILVFAFFPIVCLLQTLYCLIPHISFLHRYSINNDWVTQLLKSDTRKLEESMNEILILLQSEYHYPLKFDLVREYPQLTYTGKTTLSYTLVRLKEAVLYPNLKL